MAWLIFFLYLIFFSWLITRIGFFRRSGLSNKLLVLLFLVKIVAGIIYFQFHSLPQYKYRSDTWKFYENSIEETKLLKKDPVAFVHDLFTPGYDGAGGLFSDTNSYWNDVKDAVMIKMMAVTNVFTFNNYYANIIFFNFFFFFGLIAFYRLMKNIYPDKKYGLIAAVFFIPSFLFWCSGIHKDGLIFSCIGLVLYFFHALLGKRRPFLSTAIIVCSLVLIFLLRNYLVFALVPSLFAGWLFYLYPGRKMVIALVLLVAGSVLFFTAKYIHPSLDFPAHIADKQQQFKKLQGNTAIPYEDLEPNFRSFARDLPAAIDMSFFRPHPGEKGAISLLASVEVIFFWLVFISCIIYRRKEPASPPVIWVCYIFAFLVLLIIGYTVHFSGAVVRYRSLLLPLLLAPMIGNLGAVSNIIKKYM